MGRFITICLLAACAFSFTGCAQLKEKFIPKKKGEEKIIKRYQAVHEYDVKPSLDLYTKRYVFWKNWYTELLNVLNNDNQKKRVMAIEQEISNLWDMKRMLVDSKGDELQVYIDEMTEIEGRIKNETITGGNAVRIRRQIETTGRDIKEKFTYNKMGDYIRDEFRKE